MTPPAIVVAGGTHLEFVNWCQDNLIAQHSPLVLHVRYVGQVQPLNLSQTGTRIVDLGAGSEGSHEHEKVMMYLPTRRRLP